MADEPTPPGTPGRCQLCGKDAETRPYGPGGKQICFPCGQLDPAGTRARFAEYLKGKVVVVVVHRIPRGMLN